MLTVVECVTLRLEGGMICDLHFCSHIFFCNEHILLSSLKYITGTSLVVQWLRFHAPNAGVLGSIPGQGTRSHMHATTKSSRATTKEPASCN